MGDDDHDEATDSSRLPRKQKKIRNQQGGGKNNNKGWRWLCVLGCVAVVMFSLSRNSVTNYYYFFNNANDVGSGAGAVSSSSSSKTMMIRRQSQPPASASSASSTNSPLSNSLNGRSSDQDEYITYELIKPDTDTDDHRHASNKNKTKTLVVVFGSLRGGEVAWESLYRNVLLLDSVEYEADLAIMVGDNIPSQYANASIWNVAKYIWKVKDYDDWGDAIDIMVNTLQRQENEKQQSSQSSSSGNDDFMLNASNWRSFLASYTQNQLQQHGQQDQDQQQDPASKTIKRIASIFGGVKGYDGSGAIVFMMRWFLSQQLIKHDLVSKYDKFIITRTDHYYLCEHPRVNELYSTTLSGEEEGLNGDTDLTVRNDDRIWIPRGEKYRGISDRHFVASSANVLKALDIFPPLFVNPYRFLNLQPSQQDEGEQGRGGGGAGYIESGETGNTGILRSNPETFLKYVWDYHQLSYSSFGRSMFLISQPSIDQTRWTHGGGSGGSSGKDSNADDPTLVMVPVPSSKQQREISNSGGDSTKTTALRKQQEEGEEEDLQYEAVHFKYVSEYRQATRYCQKRQQS